MIILTVRPITAPNTTSFSVCLPDTILDQPINPVNKKIAIPIL